MTTPTILLGQTQPLTDPFATLTPGGKIETIPTGIGPDAPLTIFLTSASVDLTQVTAATLTAVDTLGNQYSPWAATLLPYPGNVAVTASAAQLTYAAQTTDIQVTGPWVLKVSLTVTGLGTILCSPVQFLVTDAWGLREE